MVSPFESPPITSAFLPITIKSKLDNCNLLSLGGDLNEPISNLNEIKWM